MGEEEKKKSEKEEEVKKPVAEGEAKKTEEKKTEEKKPEENKPEEEKKTEESKDDSPPPPPPPPPEEVVLRVYMHCEGCARKVKRCLRGFPGVEDVQTDCKFHKVIVKGKMAAADPLKVCERIQKKSHRKVELISPIPKPPEVVDSKKTEEATEENAKPEEKKEEPKVITVLLKVHMHCEACALEIQRRIMRMKGVQAAEPDPKSSQVTVKGVFDPAKLVEWVYKRTGKHATIVKTEPEEKKEEEEKGKEEKKEEEKEKEKTEVEGEKKEGEEGKTGEEEDPSNPKVELVKNEFYYYPTKYAMEYAYYPPQIFSDENPNACSIM